MKLFIKQEEGLSTTAYMDGDEVAVGYGHHVCYTPYEWIRNLYPGDAITVEVAELLFDLDILNLVTPGIESVKQDIGSHYPQNVYDVMGSIIYNVGLAGLKKSEFYKQFTLGNYEKAFTEFLLLKSKDKGIYARRKKELRILLENYNFEYHQYRMM